MPTLEPLIPHLFPFLLVLGRVLGVFFFTPVLTSATLPRQVRVVLALSFTVAVYPFVPPASFPGTLTLWGLLPMIASELFFGAVLGLIAQMPLAAMQMGGYIMGHQMGLAIARAYNPELDSDSSAVGQLLFYLGIIIFLLIGGLDIVFVALAETFHTLPIGGLHTAATPLDLLTRLLDTSFDIAMRISMPVSAVVGLILIAIGFVMKTMPQINVMSVGFSLKIMSGLLAILMMSAVLNAVAKEEIEAVLDLMRIWAADPLGTSALTGDLSAEAAARLGQEASGG